MLPEITACEWAVDKGLILGFRYATEDDRLSAFEPAAQMAFDGFIGDGYQDVEMIGYASPTAICSCIHWQSPERFMETMNRLLAIK